MIPGLWEGEDQDDYSKASESRLEPEKATPSMTYMEVRERLIVCRTTYINSPRRNISRHHWPKKSAKKVSSAEATVSNDHCHACDGTYK